MDIKVANAVGGYLETLYDANVKLIKLCGTDISSTYEKTESLVLDVIQDIFRVFPYKYDIKSKSLMLDNMAGLLEFKDTLKFLESDFSDILKNNYEFLNSIRQIRNSYQHKMHDIKLLGKGSGTLILFEIEFKISEKDICLYAGNFIKILLQLNSVYAKIQSDIDTFAYENSMTNYAYYRRLSRFDFNDFAAIYQDKNLRLIGKLMHTF